MFGLRARPRLAGPFACAVAITLTALPALAVPAQTGPADLVLSGGKIYTVDAAHSVASALATKDGKVVFVGSATDVHQHDACLPREAHAQRDILALADGGHVADVANTRVLATWFQGKKVYESCTGR